MKNCTDILSAKLKKEEDAVFKFRSLFEKYGYAPYKMTKFEEYDLYAKNKDFLLSNRVITFTDTNGKLMALKPDVTLSIVKNTASDTPINKVYYNENVYRVSESTGAFKEIMQVGLECLGDVDNYTLLETLVLAEESLKVLSNDYVLSVSNLDIVSGVLDALNLSFSDRAKVISAISSKNLGELQIVCTENNISAEGANALNSFITVYGEIDDVKDKLNVFVLNDALKEKVNAFIELLTNKDKVSKTQKLVVDFSVIDNMKYYNGLVFTGVVKGLPTSVLSGGQYNKLIARMDKSFGAIGFAIYLDQIGKLSNDEAGVDVDVVLLYGDTINPLTVIENVNSDEFKGLTVIALKEIPTKLRYGKIVKLI